MKDNNLHTFVVLKIGISERLLPWICGMRAYTDKKENKIFLLYKEIQMGSGAKSYMRNGFLIYEEMHEYFHRI